jgi:hypothetical protein
MTTGRDEVFSQLLVLLSSVRKDWAPGEEITDQTSLLGDMNWRSIELIALAQMTTEHYRQVFPFNDLIATILKRKTRDLSVGEWVDFIHAHLNGAAQPAQAQGAVESGTGGG